MRGQVAESKKNKGPTPNKKPSQLFSRKKIRVLSAISPEYRTSIKKVQQAREPNQHHNNFKAKRNRLISFEYALNQGPAPHGNILAASKAVQKISLPTSHHAQTSSSRNILTSALGVEKQVKVRQKQTSRESKHSRPKLHMFQGTKLSVKKSFRSISTKDLLRKEPNQYYDSNIEDNHNNPAHNTAAQRSIDKQKLRISKRMIQMQYLGALEQIQSRQQQIQVQREQFRMIEQIMRREVEVLQRVMLSEDRWGSHLRMDKTESWSTMQDV